MSNKFKIKPDCCNVLIPVQFRQFVIWNRNKDITNCLFFILSLNAAAAAAAAVRSDFKNRNRMCGCPYSCCLLQFGRFTTGIRTNTHSVPVPPVPQPQVPRGYSKFHLQMDDFCGSSKQQKKVGFVRSVARVTTLSTSKHWDGFKLDETKWILDSKMSLLFRLPKHEKHEILSQKNLVTPIQNMGT